MASENSIQIFFEVKPLNLIQELDCNTSLANEECFQELHFFVDKTPRVALFHRH
jgi:hypothetical protein